MQSGILSGVNAVNQGELCLKANLRNVRKGNGLAFAKILNGNAFKIRRPVKEKQVHVIF